MLPSVPRDSTSEFLLFNIFMKDLCAEIIYSEFLLFADDLKLFRIIKSAEDCKLLQSDVDSAQKWSIENYMKIKTYRINIIYFIRKTSRFHFD
jgi:hypothetical protein